MKTVKATLHADRPVTEKRLDEAIERGSMRQRSSLHAVSVGFTAPSLLIHFEDGSGVMLPVHLYPELDDFQPDDFAELMIGFAGTALCHEGKDLQISIAGMISASQPLMAMAASVIASRNGRQSSAAKAEAARVNGKKGGRPRKTDIA
ncbi:DUF2442 domain-containing protein [Pseudomonas koreensis]|uniref:DUF2442 domain-containing protein n=1 Tax=Pseudomonas koreensis TaxID=198620 RepID=A0A9X2XHX1_9PSED|nr:DUF2442 domain-containing protein [Pseudomonas koreensis]MCU7249043.1 DUF2442 domain-containing protein [Pseudomonas koreensis]